MAVRIVTDSTCDLPAWILEELGVAVVPLYIIFGGRSRKERIELTASAFYEELKTSPHFPRTSQPTPEDFLKVYEPIAEAGDEIVSIHITAKLSGTINSARLASQLLENNRVTIVDPLSTSAGLGLQVICAAEMARRGATVDEIVSRTGELARAMHLYFVVEDLNHLQRGGRIGKAAALLGSLFHLKPILTLRDGEIQPVEKAAGKRKAADRLIEKLKAATSESPPSAISVGDADDPETAEYMRSAIHALFPNIEIIQSIVGCVIGAHVGRGTVTLGWY
jgi:DegV family protein with EDD domain